MKLVRSLSTLVLMACVSILIGCSANESTSGGGTSSNNSAGSGVAGGAVVPDSAGVADVPKSTTDTTTVDPAAPAADSAALPVDPAAPPAG